MEVHEKIRSLREAKNWSQEEMADKLKMSVNGYAKIERGETKAYISKMEQIAKVLDVDLIELIPLEGKNIYLFSNNQTSGDGCHIIGSSTELAFEIEKLQLIINHKNEIITQQKQQIADLREILDMGKARTA